MPWLGGAAGSELALLGTLVASPALAAPTAAGRTLLAPTTAQAGEALDLTIDVAATVVTLRSVHDDHPDRA